MSRTGDHIPPCLGMIKKNRYFTLLETMLVITIISLISGVVAINVRKAYQQQQFRSEVAMVVETLRLAQDLMLILQDDVHVIFTQNDKGIVFWIETKSPLAKNWDAVIKRSHKSLKAVHAVKFLDELQMPTKMGELDIKFLSGGTVMSRGVIRLASTDDDNAKDALRSAICLYGYPHPIVSYSEERWGEACLLDQDTSYDDKITEMTVHAIQNPDTGEVEKEDESTD